MTTRKEQEALAERYVRRGKYREANKEYQKLLTGDEQDISIRNILGDLYVKANLEERAVEEFLRMAQYYEEKRIYSKSIALYKKVSRMVPENFEYAEKLADLFQNQGFLSESRSEYLQLAKKYTSEDRSKDAIRVYHKLLELNREDLDSRSALVDLYENEGKTEQAIEELNELAEIKMSEGKHAEAKPLLDRARNLREDHPRTLSNLIDVLKIEKKDKEALSIVKNILEKDEDNIKALKIYGNLLYAEKDFKKAEEIFTRILSLRPSENNVRVRLGKIYIHEEKINEAFALFEPIVDSFTQKKKGDKAISLLGLIVGAGYRHLPTLEKIAGIYKESGQKDNFRTVSKLLLSEYRKNNQREDMLGVLKTLLSMFPENRAYYTELNQLRQSLGIHSNEEVEHDASVLSEKPEETIEAYLAKANVYIEQGLVRNAKRILNNLIINFPDEPRIQKTIEELKDVFPDFDTEEIAERVEKASEKELLLFGEDRQTSEGRSIPPVGQDLEDGTVTAADIFADTDIIPISSSPEDKRIFFDLTGRIKEELDVMSGVLALQREKGISTFEKPLSEIIADFKKDIDEKIPEANFESRYNLGLAFLEQGLWNEAIAECELASQDPSLTIDCYLVMSASYRNKQDYREALLWIEKALELTEEGSDQAFSLKYELASLYEEINEPLKAVKIFLEVNEWKPNYRDVKKRLRHLKDSID